MAQNIDTVILGALQAKTSYNYEARSIEEGTAEVLATRASLTCIEIKCTGVAVSLPLSFLSFFILIY